MTGNDDCEPDEARSSGTSPSLVAFTERLHGSPTETEPYGAPDWRIAPPLFRPDGSAGVLQLPIPRELEAGTGSLAALATLLWYGYACDRVRYAPTGLSVLASGAAKQDRIPMLAGRPVASGGASYPVDLCVLFEEEWVEFGLDRCRRAFRYAPQYHALFVPHSELDPKLRGLRPTPKLFGSGSVRVTIVMSVNILRSWFKYRDFAYRLSAVDAGVVLGRLIMLMEALDIPSSVRFGFDARPYDQSFSLDPRAEASYCVLKLALPRSSDAPRMSLVPSGGLGRVALDVPELSADLRAMHLASHGQATRWSVASGNAGEDEHAAVSTVAPPIPLTGSALATLRSSIAERKSSADRFTGRPLSAEHLMGCLDRASSVLARIAVTSDIARSDLPTLFCCVLHVDGVESGAYRYCSSSRALQLIRPGALGEDLQRAMYLDNVHVDSAAFVLHVAAARDWVRHPFGARSYRISQMLVGAALDGAMLAVSGKDRCAHAFLGFSSERVDAIYEITDTKLRTMAQLCAGRTRRRFEIVGRVVS